MDSEAGRQTRHLLGTWQTARSVTLSGANASRATDRPGNRHFLAHARFVVLLALLLGLGGNTSQAAETCWTTGGAQFFNAMHYCVSSVLPPQGVWTYEPRNLSRPDDGGRSWCEGVPGHGIGETITLRIEGGSAFRRLLIANGYGKSRESYFANARVKEIEITTDTGIRTRAQVVDQNPLLPIYLPFPAEHDWIRIKILDVYPGTKYQDTCIDFLTPDFEYEETLLQESQQMDEGGQAPNGQLPENPDGAQGAECVTTGEIIEGTLALSQSLHPSGEQMNSLHVVLDAPTCFSIGARSIEARAVQLIFTSTLEAHRLTRLAGKRIKLKGQFFPPSTAWHTGDIIIIEPQYFLVE